MTIGDTVKHVLGLGEDLSARDKTVRQRDELVAAPPIRKSEREVREEREAADELLVAQLRAERTAAIDNVERELSATTPRALVDFRRWVQIVERETLWVTTSDAAGNPIERRRSPLYESEFSQRSPSADWNPLPARDVARVSSDAGWLREMSDLLREARTAAHGAMVFMESSALAAAVREFRLRIDDVLRVADQMRALEPEEWALIAPGREKKVTS